MPAPLELAPDIALPRARLNEVCGPARRSLAIWAARAVSGPVIWIAPAWSADPLHADGICDFTDPGRFLFVRPQRAEDLLWSMEEVLRAGAVALAIADLPGPPGLTAVRRMHLAAGTGAAEGGLAPLGLILTPDAGGAPGVETRWHMAPSHTGSRYHWTLASRRARTRPPRDWLIAQDRPGAAPYPLDRTACREHEDV